jgi:hypothetical protein
MDGGGDAAAKPLQRGTGVDIVTLPSLCSSAVDVCLRLEQGGILRNGRCIFSPILQGETACTLCADASVQQPDWSLVPQPASTQTAQPSPPSSCPHRRILLPVFSHRFPWRQPSAIWWSDLARYSFSICSGMVLHEKSGHRGYDRHRPDLGRASSITRTAGLRASDRGSSDPSWAKALVKLASNIMNAAMNKRVF